MLGGAYARICLMAGVEKNAAATEVDAEAVSDADA